MNARRRKLLEPWPSEAAMFRELIDDAASLGFRVFAETAGFDLVLVVTERAIDGLRERFGGEHCLQNGTCYADGDYAITNFEPGDTIGIEGKLRASVTLLRQACPPWRFRNVFDEHVECADYYVALVPDHDSDFWSVAGALGVTVWRYPGGPAFQEERRRVYYVPRGERTVGYNPLALPDVDIGAPEAGHPAPKRLTPWKVGAVEICLIGRQRELVRADFNARPVTVRSFADRGWIRVERGRGKDAVYSLVEHPTRPDRAFPEIAAALEKRGVSIDLNRPPGPLFEGDK